MFFWMVMMVVFMRVVLMIMSCLVLELGDGLRDAECRYVGNGF